MAAFLAVAAGLNYADRSAMSAVLPALRTEFGISDVGLGLLGSSFLWSYALCSPLAGSLADRYSRTRMVVLSLVAWSVVTAATGAVSGLSSLVGLRVALGLAECLFLPSAIALLAEQHGAATRARAISLLSVGVNCGAVVGGAFAGHLADRSGWRAGFWVLGVAGVALAFFARSFLPDAAPAPTRAAPRAASFRAAVAYLGTVPSYYALMLKSMLSGIGVWTFLSWLPLYFRDTYGMTMGAAGFAGTFMLQVSVVLGLAAGGWLSDRVAAGGTHRRMLVNALCYLAAAPFLLLFLARPGFAVVAVAISAFSFVRALGQANDSPTQCEVIPAQFRATGIGFMNACATGAGGGGVLVAGLLKREFGLDGIFACISLVFVLAGLLLLVTYRHFIRADIARAQAASLAA